MASRESDREKKGRQIERERARERNNESTWGQGKRNTEQKRDERTKMYKKCRVEREREKGGQRYGKRLVETTRGLRMGAGRGGKREGKKTLISTQRICDHHYPTFPHLLTAGGRRKGSFIYLRPQRGIQPAVAGGFQAIVHSATGKIRCYDYEITLNKTA